MVLTSIATSLPVFGSLDRMKEIHGRDIDLMGEAAKKATIAVTGNDLLDVLRRFNPLWDTNNKPVGDAIT